MSLGILFNKLIYLNLILIVIINSVNSDLDFCETSTDSVTGEEKCGLQNRYSKKRYILYDVNPPEGFNLRRDVYIRVAVFLRHLNEIDKKYQWYLVLPPWGNLYHWRNQDIDHARIPWAVFFDVNSMQKYVPVIEMHQFLKEYPVNNNESLLDCIYILQNDEEMFKTGNFEDKNIIKSCSGDRIRYKEKGDRYIGYFWGYNNISALDIKCVTFHGSISNLKQNLKPDIYRSVMFDHMEIPLHDFYGSYDYWKARRSMRYNNELYKTANYFRKKYLNSTDQSDDTERPFDWLEEKGRRSAIGGPYLAIHLRRQDFLIGHSSTVPTIKNAANQLRKKLNELKLNILFVATDAEDYEFEELQKLLSEFSVFKFQPTLKEMNKFKDGGIAIIDQIISSYARYFMGTPGSTFTFRIQEDREIIGFPAKTTFNYVCKNEKKCSTNGQWKIVWK